MSTERLPKINGCGRRPHSRHHALLFDVVSQVGCSGYRIDLGVVSPDDAGHFILGVECDGKNYHSAKTARDRDRLREAVLEGLGWRLYRIWSTDWFYNRETAQRKLLDMVNEAVVQWRNTREAESTRISTAIESYESGEQKFDFPGIASVAVIANNDSEGVLAATDL